MTRIQASAPQAYALGASGPIRGLPPVSGGTVRSVIGAGHRFIANCFIRSCFSGFRKNVVVGTGCRQGRRRCPGAGSRGRCSR